MKLQKIIIALDSFKGCLTSAEAGEAAAKGVQAACPECETIVLPVADGGEGMLDALLAASDGTRVELRAHDPLMRPRDTRYGISGDGQTAFIEMAAVSGLPLLASDERNPMLTTTFGTGELIRDALERGARNFIIGLGGSATNDAGAGMLQALGFRFLDRTGRDLSASHPRQKMCGALLSEVASIDIASAHPALRESRFTAACDVRNPLTGPDGASFVFAPQKGADREMAAALDGHLKKFAEVIRQCTGKEINDVPGAGAAGGMGGGSLAFLNAELKPGIRLLLDTLRFAERIKGANLIITGEGKSDRQTLMGKAAFGILEEARKQRVPVILLAGSVEDSDLLNQAGFQGVFSITPAPLPLEKAMEPRFAQANIQRTVEQICRMLYLY